MHKDRYTQIKDTHKYKVSVNQLTNLYNWDGEEKDQNHNDRQAEESSKNNNNKSTGPATAPQQL